ARRVLTPARGGFRGDRAQAPTRATDRDSRRTRLGGSSQGGLRSSPQDAPGRSAALRAAPKRLGGIRGRWYKAGRSAAMGRVGTALRKSGGSVRAVSALVLFLPPLATPALGDTGSRYGFGSRAEALGGSYASGAWEGYAAYANPAALSLRGEL